MAKTKRGLKSAAVREYQGKYPNATASEIVAALKEQGIKISHAMVYNIRSTSKKSRPGRKPARASASADGAAEHGGKSKAVKDAIRELGRKTPAKQIVDHLASKGVQVSLPLVNKVRSRLKLRRLRRRAMATAAAPAARRSDQVTYENLIAAKELADQLGGTDSLRRTLDILDKLR